MAEIDKLRKEVESVLGKVAQHSRKSERDELFWDIIDWILTVTEAKKN